MNYLLKRCQKSSYGGVYIRRGEHGVLGSIYKGGKREISVRSVGRLVSISTDPSRFIIG